ncbi:hypothetical protein I3760_03G015700 [Carya illinoinensis]|nr:hypothetical protein I3760_03G015700 [Carya illinoinensis]
MKTISLIGVVLLAFLLFSSPSIMARELAVHDHEADGTSTTTADRDVPAKSCGSPKGNPQYAACIGKQKPRKCSSRGIYNRRCNPPQG